MVQEGRWLRATSCQEKISVPQPQSEEKKSEQRAEEEPLKVSEEQRETEESRAEVERKQSAGQRVEQRTETTKY